MKTIFSIAGPFAVAAVSISVLFGSGPSVHAADRPNIVFILVDDLGWRDTTPYGSTFYETPNIERLAERGMLFTDAYAANPLCSPTRASILTGLYPARLRLTTPSCHLPEEVLDPKLPEKGPPTQKAVTPQTRTRLPNGYHTLAESLHEAGYVTGFFGKWHLGREPYMPKNQGFDLNVGGGPYPGPPSYFSPYRIHTLPDGPPGEHITDRLTDEAIAFLEKNRDRPFFLNFWHYSVHAPFQGKEPLIEKYRRKIDPNNPQQNPIMGAMIETLDQSVGRLLDALDRLGLSEKTIIIFTSDNGGNMYNFPDGAVATNNFPLRGGKANIYEGGVREPLIVIWPGKVRAGSRTDHIVSSIDYYPTILEILDLKHPAEAEPVDGVSFLPTLLAQPQPQRGPIFCHFPHYVPATDNLPCTSVRSGPWKLIRFFADGAGQRDRFELYNLTDDIGESRNLAAEQPERVEQLNGLIDQFLKETDALVPRANPAYRPSIGGFDGNKDAALVCGDGCLEVTSTGGDPFLTTQETPRDAGLTVLLRMQSDSRGPGRIYWTTRPEPSFALVRSVPFEPVHDGQWHDYEIVLPEPLPLRSLRIDPSTAPGTIRLDEIRLRNEKGKIVKAWSFDGE